MTEINQSTGTARFGLLACLIIWAGITVFGFYASTHMVAAGDTWVALACGRHHANHGVDVAEPFSFNSHKPGPTDEQLAGWPAWTHGLIRTIHPTGWINQNWLTHLTFYELVHLFGSEDNPNYNMLIVWKFALFIATAFVVYALGRVMRVTPLLAGIAACFAMIIGRSFFDIRPACWSNFFVPLYLLVLALAVYRNIRYIWLLIPVVAIWANFHGGYIYAYMMMVPFCGLHAVSLISRTRLRTIPFKHTLTIGYAAIASFIAMLVFNPYHLTNLTHTFEISVSKHAESWRSVNEWRPAFDFLDKTRQGAPNPVGNEEAFGVMCIILLIVLIPWVIGHLIRPHLITDKRIKPLDIEKQYANWPKIDLPMLAIALMTTYMAVQSRRFIAIAGPAVCPMIALLLQQAWQTITAASRYKQTSPIEPLAIPPACRRLSLGLYGAVCLGLGLFWGSAFYRIYLAPWPEDSVYNSIFMRMTASNVKPIDVCRFINDNQMTGRMFNYWTEGGAIAFGQKADPKTGEIPLKLFMDGRAQAAYNHDTFTLWQVIYGGTECPAVKNAFLARRAMTDTDYRAMAEWINQMLKPYDVWVVLVPMNQGNSDFMKALSRSGNWKTAYYDNCQWMMVDTRHEKGETLISSIINGSAVFPNELSRNMTLTKLLPTVFNSNLSSTLEQSAAEAFRIRPCTVTLIELINAGMTTGNHKLILDQLTAYLTDFEANRAAYRKQDGYLERLRCAIITSDNLSRNMPAKKQDYIKLANDYKAEGDTIIDRAMW
ncbi:MAG: hypothetical protein ABFD91_17085 [Anaerohalosphaeraceae bacterium]